MRKPDFYIRVGGIDIPQYNAPPRATIRIRKIGAVILLLVAVFCFWRWGFMAGWLPLLAAGALNAWEGSWDDLWDDSSD